MRLLRVYPASWRARYGDELATLLEELDGGERRSWRTRLDVIRAGLAERASVFGLRGLPPGARAREGSLLVLYAWMLFVLGGFGVQRASEHWQAVTPAAKQAIPAAAFDVLVVAAALAATLVLLGVAVLLPRVASTIRLGGWTNIRRPVLRAGLLTVLTLAAMLGLAGWAHSLTPAARNGHNVAYAGAFGAWVLLLAACLFGWAAAAAATARSLTLSTTLLRFEVWLGTAVSATMAAMTLATAVWWASLGPAASALVPNMIVPAALMLCATALGLIGATRGITALTQISARPPVT
jgi:hypothetical protein